MARLPRLTLPGLPHHVIQWGNNRCAIVQDDEDRQQWLDLVAENAGRHRVALHAWVLMDDHFHLLLTPETADGLPLMLQAVGRRYVRYFNDRHGRSGTLWEGRYRATVLQPERFVLPCMVGMDLNPVRRGGVVEPQQHPWSSHRHYIGQSVDRRLVPPAPVWALGNTPFAREAAYAEMVHAGLPAGQIDTLMQATLHGWALGDEAFVADLQKQTDRRISPRRPGRPAKNPL